MEEFAANKLGYTATSPDVGFDDTVMIQQVAFTCPPKGTEGGTYEIPQGEDPLGRLAAIGNRWRVTDAPVLRQVAEDGSMRRIAADGIRVGDFVEVDAFLELVSGRQRKENRMIAEMQYGLRGVTLMRSKEELEVSVCILYALTNLTDAAENPIRSDVAAASST